MSILVYLRSLTSRTRLRSPSPATIRPITMMDVRVRTLDSLRKAFQGRTMSTEIRQWVRSSRVHTIN